MPPGYLRGKPKCQRGLTRRPWPRGEGAREPLRVPTDGTYFHGRWDHGPTRQSIQEWGKPGSAAAEGAPLRKRSGGSRVSAGRPGDPGAREEGMEPGVPGACRVRTGLSLSRRATASGSRAGSRLVKYLLDTNACVDYLNRRSLGVVEGIQTSSGPAPRGNPGGRTRCR